MNKGLLSVISVVILVSVVVFWPAKDEQTTTTPNPQSTKDTGATSPEPAELSSSAVSDTLSSLASTQNNGSSTTRLDLVVTGISYTSEPEFRIAIIEYAGDKHEYRIDSEIDDTRAVVTDIQPDSVLVELNSIITEYRLALNSSSEAQATPVQTATETSHHSDSVEDIGNRPRELKHIVAVPANYTPGSRFIASPGLNPNLFRNAGLKEGDEILSINDLDFSLAEFFEEINNEIQTAHTLKFEVLRDGRKVILYLDIPSKEPQIR